MGILMLFFISLGLSIDAMVVAVVNSVCYSENKSDKLWIMPIFFGFFQGLMPFLGIILGKEFFSYIENKVDIFSFVIFLCLGIKMIYEGSQQQTEICNTKGLTYFTLILQAIMTSIDAFAVGFLFVSTNTPSFYVLVIGLITLILVTIAMNIGKKIAHYLCNKAHFVGGGLFIFLGFYQFFL